MLLRRCEVLATPVDALIEPLSALLTGLSIRERVPQVEVAVGESAVTLVFRTLDPASATDEQLLLEFERRHGVRALVQGWPLPMKAGRWPKRPRE